MSNSLPEGIPALSIQEDKITIALLVRSFAQLTNAGTEKLVELIIPRGMFVILVQIGKVENQIVVAFILENFDA